MRTTPLVLFHICMAVIGILSGYVAMFFRKGSGLHRAAGDVFVVSMLGMSASAAYIATFQHPIRINVVAGLLTFYVVATGWWAGRRRKPMTTSPFDLAAFTIGVTATLVAIGSAFEAAGRPKGRLDGVPPAGYLVFGTIALLFIASDVRMLLRGGLTAVKRLRRHVWRMTFALLFATVSLMPGQARQFPDSVRRNILVYIPHIFLVISMTYWLRRLRARKATLRQAEIVDTELAEAA